MDPMGLRGQMPHCPQNNRIYARNKDYFTTKTKVAHFEVVYVAVTVSYAKKFPLTLPPKGGLMNADWFVETVFPEISKNIPLTNFRDRNWVFVCGILRVATAKRSQELPRFNFPDFVDHRFIPPLP